MRKDNAGENEAKKTENEIDEQLRDSFPASDPSSWTMGHDTDQIFMKGVRIHAYGGPEQLRYENIPVPKIGDEEILVRIAAASVNPVDCKLASGALRPVMNNKAVVLPWIPGGDFSGRVEAAGKDVTDIKKGDIVYGDCPSGGAYAQFVVARANAVALKPKTLNFVGAASVPIAAQTAWQALFEHGQLRSGQTVLIHGGSGGVGSFAIQLARWKKARVLATGSADHMEYLQELGADEAIDYKTTAFETVVKGVDLVLDLVGGQTQERSFTVIRPGGRLVSTINLPSQQMAGKYQIDAMMMTMKPSTEHLNKLTVLLDGGLIKPHVTRTYPLSKAPVAWKDILSHHTAGKIVLEV
jgi:NADPH:quinone reductase-like Zn-dependent oxidoreductase